jgi:hypothetical protein
MQPVFGLTVDITFFSPVMCISIIGTNFKNFSLPKLGALVKWWWALYKKLWEAQKQDKIYIGDYKLS